MGAVSGTVRVILRVEGLIVLALSAAAYAYWSRHGWGMFILLFLAPDLSALGYLKGARTGAVMYNLAHTYAGPAVLGVAAVLWLGTLWFAVALIWCAHIGFDRAVGYGLKLPTAFQDTHLGVIGRSRSQPA